MNLFSRTIPGPKCRNEAPSLESSLSRLLSLLISSRERFNLMTGRLLAFMHMSNGAAPESDPTDPELHALLLESADFGG
jgi:hypothetical protein